MSTVCWESRKTTPQSAVDSSKELVTVERYSNGGGGLPRIPPEACLILVEPKRLAKLQEALGFQA